MGNTFGFIGCGNMGGTLAACAARATDPKSILVNDKDTGKALGLQERCGVTSVGIAELARQADMIFLGVKPQMMEDMLGEIKDILASRKDRFVLVSMAAGLTTADIKRMAGDYPVIRIMPNLAASVGEGMILFCSDGATQEELEVFTEVMSRAGILSPLDEKLIDAASAVSGCGPAFVCMFIEALADGAVRCGLARDKAMLFAQQTVIGTAKVLMETGQHPGALKDAVCSPAGTTIEGVLTLEDAGFRSAVSEAVISAYEKTLKLK
ncbi:MAG: pyrroline-5-carboxylate reductase [Eubacteriaceae bacterium]|nr:pyrroline-5-carboxylate reductase [Eubacteriaceae bacterium]